MSEGENSMEFEKSFSLLLQLKSMLPTVSFSRLHVIESRSEIFTQFFKDFETSTIIDQS